MCGMVILHKVRIWIPDTQIPESTEYQAITTLILKWWGNLIGAEIGIKKPFEHSTEWINEICILLVKLGNTFINETIVSKEDKMAGFSATILQPDKTFTIWIPD